MVNVDSPTAPASGRERSHDFADHASALGGANLNPFGDLHTLQHLSARLARSMRGVFEPLLRRAVRCWAEPVSVQRFIDYRMERGEGLTAWVPLAMSPSGGHALLVFDGRFVLELLDLFFGGSGEVPAHLPGELSPAAEAMVKRIADMVADPLTKAWEPVARIAFDACSPEFNVAMLSAFDSDDAMIVTRFGIAGEGDKPAFVDLVYPVAALKPHGASLTAKVHGRTAEPDPKWRNGLTRSAMGVRFEIRSVLAEPVISLGKLLALKEGDVIPISFGPHVPVMVANNRLGSGIVGTANGRAAIRIHAIERLDEEDFQ